MDFSVSGLVAGFIFGVIGFYVFVHGKREVNFTLVFIGIGLMAYPYFVSGPLLEWGIGLALCAAAYFYR